jgi:peptidyl-prolyl cis-trans isomerase D
MFNLFRSRDKLVRYLLGAMLLVVAASMVTYLIPNSGYTNTTDGSDPILADVGGSKITLAETQAAVDRMVKSGRLPPDALEVYLPQFLDQMIQERAAVSAFEQMGIKISDEEVLIGIMSVFPQFFQNGKLTSKDQLEQQLASQNLTLQEAIDGMREQLMLRKVQNITSTGVVVTPQELSQALIQAHEKARIQYIAFPPAKFRDQVKPTSEELHQVFEKDRAQYMVPQKRSFQVVVADQAKVESSLTISDAQLRQMYSTSMDNFRMPERVKVRHILLMTQGKSDAEKKQALAKAQDLLKQLRGGADFADLAKKNSQDPGSAQNGGDLGFIVKGQTVPEFEKVAFSAKPKDISDVVTTQYGYHILQVLEKEPARVKPFDEVKASLADQMKKQGVNDKMQMLADQAHSELEKAPGSAADVAKKLGLEVVTVEKGSAGEAIPDLGVSPEIDNALAAMKPNDVSPVMTLPANRLAVVVLKDVVPAHKAEFADVEAQVRDRVVLQKAQQLAQEAAKSAADKVRAGEDMEKVAKSFKLEAVTSADVGRVDSVEGLGPASYVSDAFKKPVGSVLGPVPIQDRNVVYKVLDHQTADPANVAPAERESVLVGLKQQKAKTQYDLFLDSVVSKLRADKKLKIHPESMQRLVAQYKQSR